jgi:hypothetical protein
LIRTVLSGNIKTVTVYHRPSAAEMPHPYAR